MTEFYMGINYNDFQLNRKPIIFKQKWIIYSSIVLLLFNAFFHMAGLYNVVVAIFTMECAIVIVSTKEIYEVFTGNEETEQEILSYIEWNKDKNKRTEIMEDYYKNWSKIIAEQPQTEYEIYLEIFKKYFKEEFLDERENSREKLQDICGELLYVLLISNKESSVIRGLSLLEDIYCSTVSCISSNKEKMESFKDGFHLFHIIYDELKDALNGLPVKKVERYFRWDTISDFILFANYWVNFDENNPYEIRALNDFAVYLGYYLSENREQERTDAIWGKTLAKFERFEDKYPVSKQIVSKQKMQLKLSYAISLIRFDMLQLLKESLYMQAMRYSNRFER